MSTQVNIGRGTILNRFVGPSDNPDRLRFEVYSDARGMNRSDVQELIIELATQLRDNPAPNFEQELKFANDTTELALAEVARMRQERDEARRDLERVISG